MGSLQTSSDPSVAIKWYLRINRDNSKIFEYVDGNGAAIDLSGYTFVCNFKNRDKDSSNFLQLTEGSGITVASNRVTYVVTKAQAAAFQDRSYFVEIVVTVSAIEHNHFTGEAVFHNGKFTGIPDEYLTSA